MRLVLPTALKSDFSTISITRSNWPDHHGALLILNCHEIEAKTRKLCNLSSLSTFQSHFAAATNRCLSKSFLGVLILQ